MLVFGDLMNLVFGILVYQLLYVYINLMRNLVGLYC